MAQRRPALTRDRIIAAAVRVADRGGLTAVTMRGVGRELQVEAMSLYHHLPGKEALLDGLADAAFASIALPPAAEPWRTAMTARAASAREVLCRHPWALGLVESRRTPGPALLAHHEAVLACLRANGFGVALAVHAFSALDAYVYGFVLTELNLPFAPGEDAEAFAGGIAHLLPVDRYPRMNEMIAELVAGRGYDHGDEFGYGLEIILDGLERRLAGGGA
ncbi:MAG: TetR/AcrR family transcriptional regulator C-terminal domain-containing protein [Thermoleophilia bacterium]|nr:TetR/AcrR family transcriptional regulator C-terminal domain-containing protein [Thermoleophilia bacterium]